MAWQAYILGSWLVIRPAAVAKAWCQSVGKWRVHQWNGMGVANLARRNPPQVVRQCTNVSSVIKCGVRAHGLIRAVCRSQTKPSLLITVDRASERAAHAGRPAGG